MCLHVSAYSSTCYSVCCLCLCSFCLFFLFVCLGLRACLFVGSSDSSDSRLPIIRRGEGSTEETYDESYADDREYHEDDHSLSSDMYY